MKLQSKIKRIRVHAGVTVRSIPQLGIDVLKDRVSMSLHPSGVLVDQGEPFGVKLIPFANVYEVDFIQDAEESGNK